MKQNSKRVGRRITSSKPPTTKTLTLHIESLSQDARGVARHEGKTVFVQDALCGEDVEAQLIAQHKNFDEAKLLKIVSPAPMRIKPRCPHYDECGGCQLQHLEHNAQIQAKQANVLNQLKRFGEQAPLKVDAPILSEAWHYRRSARIGLNVIQKDNEAIVGFRRRKSNKLLQISSCVVLDSRAESLFCDLKVTLNKLIKNKAYTHAELLFGDESQSLLLRCKGKPLQDDIATLTAFAQNKRFNLYLKTDAEQLTLLELTTNSYSLPAENITLHFQPGDFLQVNAEVNKQMIRQAIEWLNLSKEDTVLDLFCGLGNFTLPIARQVKQVTGIEGASEMVERASQNAGLNNIDNASFFQADLSSDNQNQAWLNASYNKIILDPPRTGAYELLLQLLLTQSTHAKEILYISCDPSALARDSKLLLENGYAITRFNIMDMFPHTSHVESMALFTKSSKKKRKEKSKGFRLR